MRRQTNFWNDRTNQRNFLLQLAEKKGIKHPNDWVNLTAKQVRHLVQILKLVYRYLGQEANIF